MAERLLTLALALLTTGAMLALLDTPAPATRHVAGLGLLTLALWTRTYTLWETSHD